MIFPYAVPASILFIVVSTLFGPPLSDFSEDRTHYDIVYTYNEYVYNFQGYGCNDPGATIVWDDDKIYVTDSHRWDHEFLISDYFIPADVYNKGGPFVEYKPTSLTQITEDWTFALFDASDVNTQSDMFTTFDTATPNYVWNPDCIINGYPQKSAIQAARVVGGVNIYTSLGGVLITPSHVLQCIHGGSALNWEVIFVDSAGNEHRRTVIDIIDIGWDGEVADRTDIQLCLLDTPIPYSTITPMRLISQSDIDKAYAYIYEKNIGTEGNGNGSVEPVMLHSNPNQKIMGIKINETGTWLETGYGGWSGYTWFIIVEGDLVAMNHFTGPSNGPYYNLPEIHDRIVEGCKTISGRNVGDNNYLPTYKTLDSYPVNTPYPYTEWPH